ncbi:MAG: DUF3311 domain-containing protein [Dermatophilaceae bacterium]
MTPPDTEHHDGPEPDHVDHDTVPPADTRLLVLAGALLAIPVVALLWVGSYARVEPTLGGWPFFVWYQFLWVFLCSGMTYLAHRIVLIARPHRPMRAGSEPAGTTEPGDRR